MRRDREACGALSPPDQVATGLDRRQGVGVGAPTLQQPKQRERSTLKQESSALIKTARGKSRKAEDPTRRGTKKKSIPSGSLS